MTQRRRVLACVAGGLVAAMAGPLAADEGKRVRTAESAKAVVEAALARDQAPGVQVAVMREGKIVFSHAVGKADLEQNIDLTPETLMRIGSLSKLFTYALVARLAEEGRMQIDEDVRRHVPEFPDKGAPITPRQIASHTSGIRHYDFTDQAEANNTRFYEDLAGALEIFAADPLLAAPGDAFHYSSLAVNLLGVAAGRAAGTSYPEALQRWVLGPLELRHTAPDHPLAIIPGRTRFYTLWDGRLVNTMWRDSSDYYPSGGLLSSAEDLVRFTHKVFETDFLEATSRSLMRQAAVLNDGTPVAYTFGWQIRRTEDGSVGWYHGGETNGAYAHVYIVDAGLIVAGITNYNVFPDQSNVAFFEMISDELPRLFLKKPPAGD